MRRRDRRQMLLMRPAPRRLMMLRAFTPRQRLHGGAPSVYALRCRRCRAAEIEAICRCWRRAIAAAADAGEIFMTPAPLYRLLFFTCCRVARYYDAFRRYAVYARLRHGCFTRRYTRVACLLPLMLLFTAYVDVCRLPRGSGAR